MSTDTATPDWLLTPEVGLCPCGCIGKRTKANFVDKTLSGSAGVMRQALRADDVATAPGLLQRIDPRAKVVSLIGLLVVAAFVRHTPVLLALYAVTLLLAALSAINVGFFVKRVWLFIPIFTGIVVLPATSNVITHGDIVVSLGTWFGHPIGLTSQGLNAAALIVSRVAVSISLVVLLTMTTPWTKLLAAMRSLRAPRIFILVLGMAYRYVFVLLDALDDMYTARKSRSVKANADFASGRKFVAASAGALFGKAHGLSEEVHQAMVSRGWRGEARTAQRARLTALDLVWVLSCIVLAAATIGVDRMLGG